MSFQPGAVLYTQSFGSRPEGVEVPVIQTRAPTSSDVLFPIGKRWVDSVGNGTYTLTSLSSFNGVTTPNWVSGGGAVNVIDGDTGSITGAVVTVYANNAGNNCGSTVQFVNSGTVSTLNVSDVVLGNTIIGSSAGNASISGNSNTGVGSFALANLTTGSANAALGQSSLIQLTTGSNNVGVGFGSLDTTNAGNWNIGIGIYAGDSLSGPESSNILLNSYGIANQSNTLCIGQSTGTGSQQLNAAYIQGIYSTTQNPGGTVEYVTIDNTTGLLGVTTSLTAPLGDITATNGNFVKGTAGNKDIYSSVGTTTAAGANSAGTVTLVGGTATISTTAVTASSLIRLYRQGVGATGAAALGFISLGTITAGTSFVINSVQAANATALQASDVSVVFWEIVN